MNESVLLTIQQLLVQDTADCSDGYRDGPIAASEQNRLMHHEPTDAETISELMNAFFDWLFTSVTGVTNPDYPKAEAENIIHPLLLSGIAQHTIHYLQPFPSGNGIAARTYSALVSFIHPDLAKMKEVFSPEEAINERIDEYHEVLMQGNSGDLKPFLLFYLECVNASLTKILLVLQKQNKINQVREILGKGHAKTMFELIVRMEDGAIAHRHYFDMMLDASPSSIAKNINKSKDLGILKPGEKRGEYIICIAD
ncbi:MAG: Fic family protein [Bacillus sp. (in: firmicutes)]